MVVMEYWKVYRQSNLKCYFWVVFSTVYSNTYQVASRDRPATLATTHAHTAFRSCDSLTPKRTCSPSLATFTPSTCLIIPPQAQTTTSSAETHYRKFRSVLTPNCGVLCVFLDFWNFSGNPNLCSSVKSTKFEEQFMQTVVISNHAQSLIRRLS